MCRMPSCFVDVAARVYAAPGVWSHPEIAAVCGIQEDRCLKYEWDLATRRLVQDFTMGAAPFAAKQSHDRAATDHFQAIVGTPDRLIAHVRARNWRADDLVPLLMPSARATYDAALAPARATYRTAFDAACAEARATYDAALTPARATYDAALAPARATYRTACAEAWCDLFALPENRIEIWRE